MRALIIGLSMMLAIGMAGGTILSSQTRANDTDFVIWTVESERDGGLQWLQERVNAFRQEYLTQTGKRLRITITNYSVEDLRKSLLAQPPAGLPDLVLTVNDHIAPFLRGRKLLPMTTLPGWNPNVYNPATLMPARVIGNDQVWGAPYSFGNQLVLYYNKKLVPTPPRTTDELAALAKTLTRVGQRYELTFDQTEPFWLVPWLGGFGGRVFREDGVTPNLDSPAMVGALTLLHQWKFRDRILPGKSDYAQADTAFKEGRAAMIINGDWSFLDYYFHFGEDLGIAPLPVVSSTGLWPLPYTSGTYFLLTVRNQGNVPRLALISRLVQFFARKETQLSFVHELLRLPVTQEMVQVGSWVEDPHLNRLFREAYETQKHTTPMPTNIEMSALWDAMRPNWVAVMNGVLSPELAAGDMQDAAVEAIKALGVER